MDQHCYIRANHANAPLFKYYFPHLLLTLISDYLLKLSIPHCVSRDWLYITFLHIHAICLQ